MRRMGSTALNQVDEVLLACLDEVQAGYATVEECLARYPELRAELEPLLSVALSLRGLSLEVTPAPAFKSQARARLMAEMARDGARNPEGVSPDVMLSPALSVILSTAKNLVFQALRPFALLRVTQGGVLSPLTLSPALSVILSTAKNLALLRINFAKNLLVRGVRPFAAPSLRSGLRLRVTWGPRLATAAASVVLALALASAGTVSAAQQALPGDALYPIKTASEQARLALAPSDEARGDLYLQLAEARLKEMDQSLEKGRTDATSWLAQQYQRHLAQAHALAERDGDGSLRAKLGAAGDRHQAALKAVYERVPDAAKEAIAVALAASQSFDGAQDKPSGPAAGSGPSESAAPKLPPTAPSTGSGQGTPVPRPTEAPDADPAAAGQPSGPKGVTSPTSGPDKNTPTPTPDPAKSTPTPQSKPAPAGTGEPSAPIGSGQPPSGEEPRSDPAEGKPPAVSTPSGDADPSKAQSTPIPTPTPTPGDGSSKGPSTGSGQRQGARP